MTTTLTPALDLKALERLREKLELDWVDLADTIGVDQSTLFRWRRGESSPRPMAWTRLEQLKELMQVLQRVFAGSDRAREWLKAAKPEAFDGEKTPLEVMKAGRIDKVLTVLHFLARGA
jgi:transcriptional regulator with XRE-family HTH domain